MIWNFFKPITAFVIFSVIINILGCSTDKETTKPGNIEFYETYFASEILTEWHEASLISSKKKIEMNETIDTMSLKNVSIQKGLSDLIIPFSQYTIGAVKQENKSKIESLLKRKDVSNVFPKTVKFMWSYDLEKLNYLKKDKGYILYAIRIPKSNEPYLSGKDIKNATSGYDQNSGRISIDIEMTDRGRDILAELTSSNLYRMIAITIDNKVICAPIVNNSITNGRIQITGNFTMQFTESIVKRINAFSELKNKQ